MIRFTFDKGHGWELGRFISIHLGAGWGYMHAWWTKLDRGPGNATKPGTNCGHRGIYHCNSGHCKRAYCNLIPRVPLISRGATLRVWVGPTYFSLANVRSNLRCLKQRRRGNANHTGLYSLVSFRY